ncbi:related to transposase [Fusarium fujikuroi IMI 58289]|uniref:Related to transposase n=1 Tax=Gibberella fujikuroi (strain CBS 195.34 / IMI 58289 / NRRL A-6831) TaxID=1279085 RepID=S0DS69_GIBF5|nr:related to transposase [Fusarium fujikuroi IMI 58289]XP_023427173.1 related to transposase [Fusarium fujikuroi IMI 58289]CCT63413.1 related to transposase [Fusarium fujikuroi IMI 58289]CCT65092.1 related to transposase [Fusarium fujikuroi IMI 58289]
MPSFTEKDMSAALQMVADGMSVNKAAEACGINRSTLQGRIKGSATPREAQKPRQKLSDTQEKSLRDWIVIQADLGCPVSHQQVREFASKIAVRNGFPEGVGKNWLQGFLGRNPDIRTLKGKKIDSDRYHGASSELIKAFFMLLMMPAIRLVKQGNRYNVDEVGMMEGIGMNGLFLGHQSKKSVLIRQPGSRAWITILECISATGKVLRPTVIFKGKTVQQQHFPENLDFLEDWEFACSDKGWTSNKLALVWLRKVFIPSTQPEKKNEPRLLILDGHGSHVTEDFLWECYNNNIYLLFLPAHASHVLQPLDVAVFGPLKRAYRHLLLDLTSVSDDSHVGKITFLYTYDKARREAITKSNAIAGFKATGLWPVNLAKVLMNPMVTETPSPAVTANSPAKEQDLSLLKTPRSSVQLRQALGQVPASATQDPTVRLLFRKIGSQLDRHNFDIERQNREISVLQRENEENRPKRRKKVVYNPNAEFAKIPAIKKAREQMWKTLQPERTANKVKKLKLEDLCTNFHINIH